MPLLAENSFFNTRYSVQEERARAEKRKAVESLTDVGSFQPQRVHPSLETEEREQKEPQGTSSDVFQILEVSGDPFLTAALGSTIFFGIHDVKLPPVPALKEAALLSIGTPTKFISDVKHPSLQGMSIADLVVRKNVFRASLFPNIRAEAPTIMGVHPLTSSAYDQLTEIPSPTKEAVQDILKKFATSISDVVNTKLSPLRLSLLEDSSYLLEWTFEDRRLGFSFEQSQKDSGWYFVLSTASSERYESGTMDQLEMSRLIKMMLKR